MLRKLDRSLLFLDPVTIVTIPSRSSDSSTGHNDNYLKLLNLVHSLLCRLPGVVLDEFGDVFNKAPSDILDLALVLRVFSPFISFMSDAVVNRVVGDIKSAMTGIGGGHDDVAEYVNDFLYFVTLPR